MLCSVAMGQASPGLVWLVRASGYQGVQAHATCQWQDQGKWHVCHVASLTAMLTATLAVDDHLHTLRIQIVKLALLRPGFPAS